MAATFKLLGVSDEVTTCECCGKVNLKRTVVLETENGQVYYGSDCAGRALLGKKSAANKKTVETRASALDYARRLVASGFSLADAARGVWNRYGFLTEVRGNTIVVAGAGVIAF